MGVVFNFADNHKHQLLLRFFRHKKIPITCCLQAIGMLQLYCGMVFYRVIHFTDKLKPSTDKLSSRYINVNFFEKSVKCCDVLKPFPKKLWQSAIHRPTQCQAVIFRAHKPLQIACVGFVRLGRVRCSTVSFARYVVKQGVFHKMKEQQSFLTAALKILLCYNFADWIGDVVLSKIHLQGCCIGNVQRTVLIRISRMEVDSL